MPMSRPADAARLNDPDWARLRDLVDRYEDTWHSTGSADLGPLLPPPGDPLRLTFLHDLLKCDLQIRWSRGLTVRLETYLERFPELGTTQTCDPLLIYEEYRARQIYGDKPPETEFQTRFPEQFPEVKRLIGEQPVNAIQPPTLRQPAPLAATPVQPAKAVTSP